MDKDISVTIIEDNPLTAINLKQLLEEKQFVVDHIYASGEHYLLESDENESDIVLIDVQLKGTVTGIDIGKKLMESHPEKHLIFITGKYDDETISEILKLKPVCYICKPYDESTLLVKFKHCCIKNKKAKKYPTEKDYDSEWTKSV